VGAAYPLAQYFHRDLPIGENRGCDLLHMAMVDRCFIWCKYVPQAADL
jgi:hypothetical protein